MTLGHDRTVTRLRATNETSSTVWQVSVTDLTRQVLESSRDLQARHDQQLETILTSLGPRFDRLDNAIGKVEEKLGAQISNVEKDLARVEKELGAQITKVEKDVTFIRAAGTVMVILITLAVKIPSKVWEKLFMIEP